MKVAFVLGTSTGGTGRHVRMLAAGCAARGVPVQVFGPAKTDRDFGFSTGARTRGSGPAGGQVPAAQVGFSPVDIADRPRVLADLRAVARLRGLVGTGQYDVVHAHGMRAGALTAIAVAPVRPRHRAGPPALIVTVHNAPAEGGLKGAIYHALELIVARNADSVLCVSPDLEARMLTVGARRVGRAVVPPDAGPVSAVPVPPDTGPAPAAPVPLTAAAAAVDPVSAPEDVSAEARRASQDGLPACAGSGRPVVLAVGRLASQKGFGTLLAAAALWRDLRPEPCLAIVGEGPLDAQLKRQAASLGVTAQFTGSRSDVPALLASAAVFVLPSVWEGQPLILQEALRAGVPIVATRVGGTPGLTGEEAALLVPPGDAERLAAAVRAVLTDPELASSLRLAALERALGLPSEDDAVAAVLTEYRRVKRL
jgi:glycosyltransferase involved in cell wall biosynthesis